MGTSHINGVPINNIVGGDGIHSGVISMASGKFEVDDVAVVSAAEDLNASAKDSKVQIYTDFFGKAADSSDEPLVQEKQGSGTGNAVTLATASPGGVISIKSASDDGVFTANASAIALGALDWQADMGSLVMEARLQCDDVSEAYIFVGFTDVLPGTTLEQPIFLTAADIDSDATDACGVCYDIDGTTKQWFHGGVKAGTDTVPAYSGAAPTEAAYETIRVEVSAAGAVRGYVDGTAIGPAVSAAVTATTPLVPVIVVANRSANAVTVLVDYVWVQADRA